MGPIIPCRKLECLVDDVIHRLGNTLGLNQFLKVTLMVKKCITDSLQAQPVVVKHFFAIVKISNDPVLSSVNRLFMTNIT